MIPIRRRPLPAELVARLLPLTDEIRAQPNRARALWRRTSTRTNVIEPLRTVLQQMASGNERCMYCGDSFGTDIDHHEPLARNPLRTFDWLNHLLACAHCNSHHKRELFPTDLSGNPLLIDPTAEDPFDHLVLALSAGEYAPLTDKGRETIEVCGLNRFVLARARQQAYRVVVLCLREWQRSEGTEPAELLTTIREQPCADVCQRTSGSGCAGGLGQ